MLFYRYMSHVELSETRRTGLLRAGRPRTHYVTPNSYATAADAPSALALQDLPEVEVYMDIASSPRATRKVKPAFDRAGGGTESEYIGEVRVQLIGVRSL